LCYASPCFHPGQIRPHGDLPQRKLDTFEILVWLNSLAEKGYSQAVVRHCFTNMRAITHMAKKK
jgi:hypothetical protein